MIKNWDEEEESIHLEKTNKKSGRWPFCSNRTVMRLLCWAIQAYSPRLVRQSSEDHVFVPIPHSSYKQSPSSIFPRRHSTQNIAERKQNIIKIKDYINQWKGNNKTPTQNLGNLFVREMTSAHKHCHAETEKTFYLLEAVKLMETFLYPAAMTFQPVCKFS